MTRLCSLLVLMGLLACTDVTPSSLRPDVPGGAAPPSPATGVAAIGRYTVRVSPRQGTWVLETRGAARSYDYSGAAIEWVTCPGSTDCLPAVGEVALFTDQSLVSFVDGTGTCFGDGCATLASRPACQELGTFCGPLQVTSNLPDLLHDVVVQLSHGGAQGNLIEGCQPDAAAGTGLCAEDAETLPRVDGLQSNLTSPIVGDSLAGDLPCSFCVGHAATARTAGLPGLIHVVVPGQTAPQHGAQRVFAALRLANENDFSVDLDVLTAAPVVDAIVIENGSVVGASCATSGVTTVTATGHGFGGPGICLAVEAAECPASGDPTFGYAVTGSAAATTVRSWAADQVVAYLPEDAIVPTGGLTLTTSAAGDAPLPIDACTCASLPTSCPGTCSDASGEGVCTCVSPGFVNTQAGVDALAGCHVLDGTVVFLGLDITSLEPLTSLRQVNGNLAVSFSGLSDLSGLRHLARAGNLIFNTNGMLTSVELPEVLSMANFTVQNSGQVTVVSIPLALTGGVIRIINNASLADVTFGRLIVGTSVEIRGNPALTLVFMPLLNIVDSLVVHTNANLCQSRVDALDSAAFPADCTQAPSVCTPNLGGC